MSDLQQGMDCPWFSSYDKGVPHDIVIPEGGLQNILDTAAETYGQREAIVFQNTHISFRELKELAEKLGMKVKTPKVPVGGGLVLFAQFVEPDEITIFTDCVDKASKLEEECGCDLLRRENLTNTLLAHELFHAVEEQHVKEIYTRTERVELWRKPFSNKSTISCLSEIAAMAFAGKLLDLKVSPYMLDVLLVYSYDKNAAWGLYDEIMNMTKKQ